MRITSKANFAISALIELALQRPGSFISLQSIATRQSISVSYLEHLFAKLRRHTLVLSTRGPGGGYALARPADTISIADIVKAVDQQSGLPFDHGIPAAGGLTLEARITESLWSRADMFLQCTLEEIDLQSLAEPYRDAEAAKSNMTRVPRSPVLQRPKSLGQKSRVRSVTSVFDMAEMDA